MNRVVYILLSFFLLCSGISSAQDRSQAEKENLIVAAVEMYGKRDIAGAEKILKTVLENDSDNDAASYYMALCKVLEKDMESAELYFKKAVDADPKNFWYKYSLAKLYEMTSRTELTVKMFEEMVKMFPRKSDLYFDMAQLYSDQGEYEKALATLDEIETVFGKNESTVVYRFNLLLKMKRNEEAYSSLEKYNEEYSSPYVLSTLADWQMSMYNDSTSLAYYNEALDISPDYVPALLGKAEAMRITRRYDGYFSTLNRFVSLKDYGPEGKCDYLMAVVGQSDPKFIKSFTPQLDTVFNNLLQTHPCDSTTLRSIAVYYYSSGRIEKADSCFRENVRLYPSSMSMNAEFVEFLMYAGKWQELSHQGRASFVKFPHNVQFLEMASIGDYNSGNLDGVLQLCEVVLETAPKDSSATLRAWSTTGDMYYQKGDRKKAYKAYEKALKVNPDYVYVLNNYAYYLSVEGKNLKKAYSMSRKTVEAEPDNPTYLDTFGWILYLQGKSLEAKPFFKHAMLYGGKESAVILDHYAEVLYSLKEYELAYVYWNMAFQKDKGTIPGLEEKIARRKQDAK